MTPDMITAIAGLWKLVAAIVVLIAIFLFRKPITDRIGRLSRLKTKDTEVRFDDYKKEETQELETVSQPSKPAIEEADKKIIPDITSRPEEADNFFGNMIDAFFSKDSESAKKNFDALQASESDLNARLKNEVLYNFFSYTKLQRSGAIEELLRLSEIGEIRSFALSWLSNCYEFDNAFDKAKSSLKLSLESATSNEEKAHRAKALVDLLLKTESPINEAIEVLANIINTIPTESRTPIYLAYAAVYEKTQDKLLRAIALEKAIELSPNDRVEIFNAAYAQSEAELPALAIINYETIIRQNPENASALNNLGVAYDKLDMPIQSVIFYREASNKNETLAMSNLAYKLIGQGFISEGEDLLKKAQEQKDIHPNVMEALASIEKRKTSEANKKEKLASTGIKQKNFMNKYADARFTQKYEEGIFNGKWKYNSDIITVEEKEKSIFAEWGKSPNKRRLKGEIAGCSANLAFENQVTWITSSESYSVTNRGLCFISPDRKAIHIMILSKDNPEFMEFTQESE